MLTEYNSQKIVQTKQSEVGQIPHMTMLRRVATDLVSSNGRCENRSYNFSWHNGDIRVGNKYFRCTLGMFVNCFIFVFLFLFCFFYK